ncbi:uncharacterized protein LOC131002950, partial [Salvia miltiorrhiza]|uniref:uncharacterized protein LOC131002950 n=1 Tax=Salvia miltiorrhiza TaxID=226208 RepID=UPI0025ACE757
MVQDQSYGKIAQLIRDGVIRPSDVKGIIHVRRRDGTIKRCIVFEDPEQRSEEVVSSNHITLSEEVNIEEEDAEMAPQQFEEGVKSTIDELKEINLGTIHEPRSTFISALLTKDEEGAYVELLKEFKDKFAWSYKEMPGLNPKIDVHHLAIAYFHAFGSKCFIHNNDKKRLNTFDSKADPGVFLGYSGTERSSKAYRVFNTQTLCVEETPHVIFDESTDGFREQEAEKCVQNTEGSRAEIHNTEPSTVLIWGPGKDEDTEMLQYQKINRRSEVQTGANADGISQGGTPVAEVRVERAEAAPAQLTPAPEGAQHPRTILTEEAPPSPEEIKKYRRWFELHSKENIIGEPSDGVKTRR